MIQCWELEVEIQTFMKVHSCYTTRDNSEVTLQHVFVVVPVSTYTHQPCVHRYFYFHYWWTAVAWYLTDQVKSDRVLQNLATHAFCYIKIWMTVDEPRTSELG